MSKVTVAEGIADEGRERPECCSQCGNALPPDHHWRNDDFWSDSYYCSPDCLRQAICEEEARNQEDET